MYMYPYTYKRMQRAYLHPHVCLCACAYMYVACAFISACVPVYVVLMVKEQQVSPGKGELSNLEVPEGLAARSGSCGGEVGL